MNTNRVYKTYTEPALANVGELWIVSKLVKLFFEAAEIWF